MKNPIPPDDEQDERYRREGIENSSYVIWLVICGLAVLALAAGIAFFEWLQHG